MISIAVANHPAVIAFVSARMMRLQAMNHEKLLAELPDLLAELAECAAQVDFLDKVYMRRTSAPRPSAVREIAALMEEVKT